MASYATLLIYWSSIPLSLMTLPNLKRLEDGPPIKKNEDSCHRKIELRGLSWSRPEAGTRRPSHASPLLNGKGPGGLPTYPLSSQFLRDPETFYNSSQIWKWLKPRIHNTTCST